MRQFLLCSAVVAALAACPMLAGAEVVTLAGNNTYYSWLQLPMNANITPSLGSESGVVGGTPGSSIDGFRYGGLWFPTRAMTGNPAGTDTGDDYWMVLTLDQARWIDYVGVGWTTGSQTTLHKYYIEAYVYNDVSEDWGWIRVGESADNLNGVDAEGNRVVAASGPYYNGPRPGWRDGTNLSNAIKLDLPGEYQSIRVYVEAGDYNASGNGSAGGPGIRVIEPMAANREVEIETSQINWANAIFGTTATGSTAVTTLSRRAVAWLTKGSLIEDENAGRNVGVWGETALIATSDDNVRTWDSSIWIDFNLGQARWIDEVVAVWALDGVGTDFRLQYGLVDEDGAIIGWSDVTGKELTQYGGTRATSMEFDGVEAQYWRISEAVFGTTGNNCGINQVLMYGAIPEPATMSLLALGGLALLRRRK